MLYLGFSEKVLFFMIKNYFKDRESYKNWIDQRIDEK